MPKLTVAELNAFVASSFPANPPRVRVEDAGDGTVRIRHLFDPTLDLRPGDTVAGPVLMGLADLVGYVLVAAALGPVYQAVTTSLHVDFVRRPKAGDLLADGQLVKLGSRLAVARVDLRTEGDERLVAIASVTYALPPATKAVGA